MGETNSENKKKTAREIIEITMVRKCGSWKCVAPTLMKFSVWVSENCCRSRWN